MKAVVVGAGIGGLAAAIALKQAGVEVEVYERTASLEAIGAGLTLWPNAMKALAMIGLDEAVRARGAKVSAGAVRDWRGRVLQRQSAALERKYSGLILGIHRADLQAALLTALGPDTVCVGRECVGFREDDGGVAALFAGGRTARANILVGADGLRSAIRSQLWGAAPPTYAGYTAWRGVAAMAEEVPAGEWWGCGMRFGMLPIGGGRVYWFATANVPEAGSDRSEGRQAELLSRFGAWQEPIPTIIAATDDAAILRNDIYDRPPLPAWGRGRVTLLGDAAHPMTPNMGQGACQAIEDAVVLAACLGDAVVVGDAAAALRTYEAARNERTRKITLQSRRIGEVGQWQGALACNVRNILLRLIPSRLQERALAWVYEAPGWQKSGDA